MLSPSEALLLVLLVLRAPAAALAPAPASAGIASEVPVVNDAPRKMCVSLVALVYEPVPLAPGCTMEIWICELLLPVAVFLVE